jgi:hypothetical protein
MARMMNGESTKLYRVVVVNERTHGDFQYIYGPYEHKRTAGFVKSYMTGGWYSRNVKDSWIEVSEPTWEKDG